MKVLVYTQSYFVRNIFVTSLIPNGINLIHVEMKDALFAKVENENPDIIILDVIREDFDEVFQIIKVLKSNPKEEVKAIAIVLLVGGISKDYITDAVKLGVLGFIKSNATKEFISEYLIKLYEKLKGVPPLRKFARVSLNPSNPNDKVGVKFRSPINSQLIIGVIKDISYGGMAVELVGTFPPDSIAVALEIKNVQFMLEGKDINVDMVVVAYQKNFCAFRFVNMAKDVQDAISHFIFQRLASI